MVWGEQFYACRAREFAVVHKLSRLFVQGSGAFLTEPLMTVIGVDQHGGKKLMPDLILTVTRELRPARGDLNFDVPGVSSRRAGLHFPADGFAFFPFGAHEFVVELEIHPQPGR